MRRGDVAGYCVVEFNEGLAPRVVEHSFTPVAAAAVADARNERVAAAAAGQPWRFATAEVRLIEDPE